MLSLGIDYYAYTRAALEASLHEFVSQQNAGKSGQFVMDQALYADGQSQTTNLQGEWDLSALAGAIGAYQTGAIIELLIELRRALGNSRNNTLGPHGEPPSDRVVDLKGKLRNVLITDDLAAGLPRMFYRETRRSSIGSLPAPQLIIEALSENPDLAIRSQLLKALSKADHKRFEAILAAPARGHTDHLTTVAQIAAITAKPGSDPELFSANKLSELIESAGNPELSAQSYLYYAAPFAREESLPNAEERVRAYNDLALGSNTDDQFSQTLVQSGFDGIMKHAKKISDPKKRASAYIDAAEHAAKIVNRSGEKLAVSKFLDYANSLEDGTQRLDFYRAACNSHSTAMIGISFKGILDNLQYEPDLAKRCEDYKNIGRRVEDSSPEQLKAFEGMIECAHAIPKVDHRIQGYYKQVIHNTPKNTPQNNEIRNKALQKILDCVDGLDTAEQRIETCNSLMHFAESEMREKYVAYVIEQTSDCRDSAYKIQSYENLGVFSKWGSPLRQIAAKGILDNLDGSAMWFTPARQVEACSKAATLVYGDEETIQRAVVEAERIAATIGDPKERFDACHGMALYAKGGSPELNRLVSQMLNSAEQLRDFDSFKEAAFYTPANSEQRNQAVDGMLKYVKGSDPSWVRAKVSQAPLYIELLKYAPEGSEQQNRALTSFSECLEPFTPEERFEAYRDLARAFAYDKTPWKFGVEGQLETVKTLPTAQQRLVKLQTLRSVVSEPLSLQFDPQTPTAILKAAGEMILDDIARLKSPASRVATAQRLLKGEVSYLFEKNSPAYKDEIKLRSTAEKIIMANGVLPLPDHRAGSRLMSILDRDDVSHAVYMTTETIKAAKRHLNGLCHISLWNAPTQSPNRIDNASGAENIAATTNLLPVEKVKQHITDPFKQSVPQNKGVPRQVTTAPVV